MLFINAGLGFREEYNANRAAGELKDALKHEVSVKRDGAMGMLEVEMLVPGDIIFVKGGQNVPADCTFLEGDQARI